MFLRAASFAVFIGLVFLAVGFGGEGAQTQPLTPTERLVFQSQRQPAGLYIMAPDGSDVRPVPGSADAEFPRWSPDGSKIAFMSSVDGNWEIYTMSPDGTGRTRLTNDTAFDGYANWSPDGSRLVFMGGGGRIFVMNADGSNVTDLHPGSRPSWSADGSKIVFELNFDLFVMNADGSGVSPFSQRPEAEYQPAWSPDDEEVAFVDDVPGPWYHFEQIYVWNRTTGILRSVSGGPAPNESTSPRWSPDSSHLVFTTMRDGNSANEELYTVRRDGTELTRLTFDPGADWNADWGRTSTLPPQPPPPPPPPPPPAAPNCVVPRVVGFRLARARAQIRHSKCAVGRIRRARSRRVGRVLAQKPLAGTVRPAGSRVRLVVGRR